MALQAATTASSASSSSVSIASAPAQGDGRIAAIAQGVLPQAAKEEAEPADAEGRNALHGAAIAGRTDLLRLLLVKKKHLINSKDRNDSTPLMFAAQEGHLAVCEILLDAGANVDAMNSFGFNAFHYAVSKGNSSIVRLFTKYKHLLELRDRNGATPLVLAAEGGHREVCKVLLDTGVNPNAGPNAEITIAVDGAGRNLLHIAAMQGKTDLIRLHLARGYSADSQDNRNNTPLMLAAGRGKLEACKILLEAGANVYATTRDQSYEARNWENALQHAVRGGNLEVVRLFVGYKELLDQGDTYYHCYTPLMVAVQLGNREACEILLKAGANVALVNLNRENVLHLAVRRNPGFVGLFAKYKQLLEVEDKFGHTPLMRAAERGYIEACRIILKAGADFRTSTGLIFQETAIDFARAHNYEAVVKLLSPFEPQPKTPASPPPLGYQSELVDKEDRNLLHMVAMEGGVDLLRMLLEQEKYSIDSKDTYGNTPLMLAASKGQLEACEILFKAGANIGATNKDGQSVLHHAAVGGNPGVVRLFVRVGYKSPVDLKSKQHVTPLMLAAFHGHREACKILIDAGASVDAVNDFDPEAGRRFGAKGGISGREDLIAIFECPTFRERSKGCEILQELGTNVNVLHLAARRGDPELMRLFIVYTRLLDLKNKNGYTPLMLAAAHGHLGTCVVLLRAGADIKPSTSFFFGKTALELARENGHEAVVRLLMNPTQLPALPMASSTAHTSSSSSSTVAPTAPAVVVPRVSPPAVASSTSSSSRVTAPTAPSSSSAARAPSASSRVVPPIVPAVVAPRTSSASVVSSTSSSSRVTAPAAPPASSTARATSTSSSVTTPTAPAVMAPPLSASSASPSSSIAIASVLPTPPLPPAPSTSHQTAFSPEVMAQLLALPPPAVLAGALEKLAALDIAALQKLQGYAGRFDRLLEADVKLSLVDAERIEIDSNPATQIYYRFFSRFLTGTWIACQGINCGKLENAEKEALDYLGEGIDLVLRGLPGVSIASGAAAYILSTWTGVEKRIGVQRISLLFPDLDTAFRDLGMLAREVTLAQKDAILKCDSQPMGFLGSVKAKAKDLKASILGEDVRGPLRRKAIDDCNLVLTAIKNGVPLSGLSAVVPRGVSSVTNSRAQRAAVIAAVTPVFSPSLSSSAATAGAPARTAPISPDIAERMRKIEEENERLLEKLRKLEAQAKPSEEDLVVSGANAVQAQLMANRSPHDTARRSVAAPLAAVEDQVLVVTTHVAIHSERLDEHAGNIEAIKAELYALKKAKSKK